MLIFFSSYHHLRRLYDELGKPDHAQLPNLSIEHYRKYGHHIKVAIDVAIWSFQSQTVHGRPGVGSNASIRVLYYRLCDLLKLNIHAVFVFDGKDRPAFKRNKVVCRTEGYHLALIRRLIKSFGFPMHNAPGEAEAECAYLQKQGIVDVVLSEDVDTLVFGSKALWRSVPAQHRENGKARFSMLVYKAQSILAESKLDHTGLILIALLNGGDYDSGGVPGFGIKQAAAAARAGYADSLVEAVRLMSSDNGQALAAWRSRLETSLRTNHEGIFAKRQPNAKVPDAFPDLTVLDFYLHPKVSEKVPRIDWNIDPDPHRIHEFTKAVFNWNGSGKLIRTLSEKLLSWQLGHNTPDAQSKILDIISRRFETEPDAPTVLRIAICPLDIIPIPYDHSIDNVSLRTTPALITAPRDPELDNTYYDSDSTDDIRIKGSNTMSTSLGRSVVDKSIYDPREACRVWVYEDFVKIGAFEQLQMWEASESRRKCQSEKSSRDSKRDNTHRSNASLIPIATTKAKLLTQQSLNSFFAKGKVAAGRGSQSSAGPKPTLEVKETAPTRTSIKAVPRVSIPGTWKVVGDDEYNKYDDPELDAIDVWDLTGIS